MKIHLENECTHKVKVPDAPPKLMLSKVKAQKANVGPMPPVEEEDIDMGGLFGEDDDY